MAAALVHLPFSVPPFSVPPSLLAEATSVPRLKLETWNLKLYCLAAMPTYVYETIPQTEGETPKRFEVRQSMKDAPFTHHPDNGTPVRRVPIGGTGLMGGSSGAPMSGGGSCGTGCGCH